MTTVSEATRCIIEARNTDERSHANWDSDYVTNESMTLADARQYIVELRTAAERTTIDANDNDTDWRGWEFRIRAEVDGSYCETVV